MTWVESYICVIARWKGTATVGSGVPAGVLEGYAGHNPVVCHCVVAGSRVCKLFQRRQNSDHLWSVACIQQIFKSPCQA